MANITPIVTQVQGFTALDGWKAVWNMAAGDIGLPTQLGGNADRSLQVDGTFGPAGALVAEGSNDGSIYHQLTDPQGTPISITSPFIKQVTETTMFFRPHVTGGDGSTALVVTAFFRKTHTP